MSTATLSQTTQRLNSFSTGFVVWGFISLIALAILGAIIAAPFALATGYGTFASGIYKGFSYLCHQLPERSFHLAGEKFAVCSRCTGLYAGFAITALVYPLIKSLKNTDTPSRLWLVLAAAPLAIDFGLGYFNIWQNTHASRFLTGGLLSSVAVFFIVPGIIELGASAARSLRISERS